MTIQLNKILLAKKSLITSCPFYASIILNLKIIETTSVKTFCVNSSELNFNPEFSETLSLKNVIIVLKHEVLHLVFKHHLRSTTLTKFNHEMWNIACDLAINTDLSCEDGFPECGIFPGDGEYIDFPDGLSAEQYYKMVMKDADDSDDQNKDTEKSDDQNDNESNENNNDGNSDSDNNNDESDNSDSDSNSESNGDSSGTDDSKKMKKISFGDVEQVDDGSVESEKAKIEQMVNTAISTCAGLGKIPDVVRNNLDEILGESKTPWQVILRNHLSNKNLKYGINWAKPSRRNTTEFIIPTKRVKAPSDIMLYGDVSWSCSEYIHDIIREVMAVASVGQKIKFAQFDTVLHSVQTIENTTKISDIEIIEGGGTYFGSVIDHLKTLKETPKLVIVYSDMYFENGKTDWRKELHGIDVIWLSTSGIECKPGKTIHVND